MKMKVESIKMDWNDKDKGNDTSKEESSIKNCKSQQINLVTEIKNTLGTALIHQANAR